ncbi:hypothetical protein [Tumebacillus flagellatus]|uniref:Uncharacterized protein n=1 Tax=Tumebacillus flagellatus TaxID=1157490 RepID=A0A074LPD6_9BACL|nr:hypothetical protein [Tumebacillus flagellatus]KEO84016.1 hypothetical protein EL26_07480 [Tumebacillus flagellatus]
MRKKSNLRAGMLLFLTLVLGSSLPLSGAYGGIEYRNSNEPSPIARHVVLLLLDGLRLSDITPERTPNLWKMQDVGSIGVMNLNTLGAKTDVNAALTLGSGNRAGANLAAAEAYRTSETVQQDGQTVTGGDLYVRHTGQTSNAGVVLPQWPQILVSMDKQKYNTSTLGLLGDILHEAGGKTAVLANSDLGQEINRPAALIASDSLGQVDLGSFQAGRVTDPARPYGMRTDPGVFYESYQKIKQAANLIVLEPGDLVRWSKARELMQERQAARTFEEALRDGDALVGKLLADAGPNTMIAVTSPVKHPTADAPALSPVLLAGGDIMAGGMLSSATTKRKGLLANTDLAPTFARFLRGNGYVGERYDWLGQPVVSQTVMNTQTENFELLKSQVDAMLVPSFARAVLVKPWLNTWIAFAALILLLELFRRSWLKVLAPLTEALLIFPLTWLFVPLFNPVNNEQTILYSLGLTLSIWMMARGIRDPLNRLGAIAGVTVLTLVVDMLIGAPLLERSVLSYDPIAGARYYGIGNEYMGVLLGALFLFLNAWNRAKRKLTVRGRVWATGVFLAVIYLFAAPKFGTNAGGALAAAAGCTYALMQFSRWRMTRRNWIVLSAASGVVILGMLALNLTLPGADQTHIGRAAQELVDGKFAALYQIAMRKLQLNFLLLRVSPWGRLFVLLLLFLLLRVYRRKTTSPVLRRNGRMVLMGAAAALLFNDSGVVAAALALLYAAAPLVEAPPKREMEFCKWDILANDTAPQE